MDPSERVVIGTVASVSASGITITTGTGQTVTVGRRTSTAYWQTGSLATARAVTRGVRVAVLCTAAGPALCASAVAVLPPHIWA
ncbi:MAG: hypothetical protein ACM32E_19295 [Gemmatimonadota bacterium]